MTTQNPVGSGRPKHTNDASVNGITLLGAILVLLLLVGGGTVAVLRATGRAFVSPTATPTSAPTHTATVTPLPANTALPTPTPTQATPTPTATATPFPQVAIGATVVVTGTEGLDLRLRAGPGLDFVTFKIVHEGARLVVQDGPQEEDGFTWWRVRDEQDVAGWVVQDWLKPVSPGTTQPAPSPGTTALPAP